jgi:hypothetical protein
VIAEGAFIEVLFPTTEKPRQPGLPHICYCLAVRPPLGLVAYTTSAPWPPKTPLPLGVRRFSQEEAIALNQRRAFRLHLIPGSEKIDACAAVSWPRVSQPSMSFQAASKKDVGDRPSPAMTRVSLAQRWLV